MSARDSALLALALLVAPGCSIDTASQAKAGAAGTGGFGGTGGMAGAAGTSSEPVPATLAFSPPEPILLTPGGSEQLTVVASPPAAYTVHFALLGSAMGSGAGDAALDVSKQSTDSSGRLTVKLTAPSMPMSFTVRASVGPSLQTLLGVTVNGTNLTTLSVLHAYSGHRPVSEWTATAWESTDCGALTGSPPPDGGHLNMSAANSPLVLSGVPVAKNLAITLRAGHYVGGCANVPALSEGGSNEVLVFASDRPINLEQTTLAVAFGFSNLSGDLGALMTSALDDSVAALGAGKNDDVAALLDAMHDATPSSARASFDAARSAGGWGSALAAAYGNGASSKLRDGARAWLNDGLTRLAAADTFQGTITPYSATSARFDLSSVAGLSPDSAGFSLGSSSTWSVSWAADSNDNLLLGTALGWIPSRLVTGLAVAPALAQSPGAQAIDEALAQLAQCPLVASVAVTNGANPNVSAYDACDAACMTSSCQTAVSALWQAARDASGSSAATLSVTVTGNSQVGDEANVVAVQGSWVGKLSVGSASAATDGLFSGAAP